MTVRGADKAIEQITSAFSTSGHLAYGEHISMGEHMLQAAHIAEQNGEPESIVVATLLHDYGHLICNMPDQIFAQGRNNNHEHMGAAALKDWFGAETVSPIRLHVEAKRYLCATDQDYENQLSQASIMTLSIQGGPMRESEVAEFKELPGYERALRVRRYDDLGKREHMERPDLDYYLAMIRRCIQQ